MYLPTILAAVFACLFSFAAGVSAAGDRGSAGPPVLSALAILIACGLFASAYGDQKRRNGLKEATVQCRTGECPYRLTVNPDSTREWTIRKSVK
jgi:hypothetical protein